MKFLHHFSILVLVPIFIFISACGSEKKSETNTENKGRELELVEQVTFVSLSGEEISTIRAALADEPEERNQGLMDVTDMPMDAGMLFIFPDEAPRSFYMANTHLPLDIIFVSADSTIVRIHHNTAPFNTGQLPSGKPAKYVVETNGGYCVSNDIQEGMKIKF
jgi:uncharacterized membrane protein (UPF0127 family)